MGLDVRVHVLDKHWNKKHVEIFDYLPYEFRFTFYPDCSDVMYNGVLHGEDAVTDPRYEKVRDIMHWGCWSTFVPIKAVKEYMNDRKEDTEVAHRLYEFDDTDVVLVTGDQLYSRLIGCDAPTEPYGKDLPMDVYAWFKELSYEDKRKLHEYSSVLHNALLTATMTDDLLPLLTGFRELHKL